MNTRYAAVIAALTLCATPLMAAVAPQGVTNMGNVRGGDMKAARGIIETKCTRCHSGNVIDAAIFANKDMLKIQQEMEKKGVKLNTNEQDVLGIYWKQQNPLKMRK
ncbi:MAG: cytochrome C [Verrucomicrobia bacterium]|nr:cytochrome C [Deltaproteobacteria bacterium]